MTQKPDEVCRMYAPRGVGIGISIIEQDEGNGPPLMHVSGDGKSLEFLGKLIIAMSSTGASNTKQIFPSGPGSVFFDETSSFGIYIERLIDRRTKKEASGS
jgi:hypothetical protein